MVTISNYKSLSEQARTWVREQIVELYRHNEFNVKDFIAWCNKNKFRRRTLTANRVCRLLYIDSHFEKTGVMTFRYIGNINYWVERQHMKAKYYLIKQANRHLPKNTQHKNFNRHP